MKYNSMLKYKDILFPGMMDVNPAVTSFFAAIVDNTGFYDISKKIVTIDISGKTVPVKTNESRIQVAYPHSQYTYDRYLDFAEKLKQRGYDIDFNGVLSLIGQKDMSNARLITFGLDMRDGFEDSRVKLLFEYISPPSLGEVVINQRMVLDSPLSTQPCHLIGVDYFLDGGYGLKAYARYGRPFNTVPKEVLNPAVLSALEICDTFFIAYKGGIPAMYVYFASRDIPQVMARLGFSDVDVGPLGEAKPYMIGLYHNQIGTSSLTEYNIYFNEN